MVERADSTRRGDDFLVAGRTLPAHVLVFTLLSTWIGSGSLFAGAGLGYRVGLPALWQSAGAWVGIAVIFFLAPRVRRLAQFTVPDILEAALWPRRARARDDHHRVRLHRDRRLSVPRRRPAAEPRRRHRSGDRRDHHRGVLRRASPRSAGMRSVARLDVVNGLMMLAASASRVVYLLGRAGGRGAGAGVAAAGSADACSARCRRVRRWRCSCRRCACCSAKRTCIRSSSRPATNAPRGARSPAGSSAPSWSNR